MTKFDPKNPRIGAQVSASGILGSDYIGLLHQEPEGWFTVELLGFYRVSVIQDSIRYTGGSR